MLPYNTRKENIVAYITTEETREIRNALKETFKNTTFKFGVKKDHYSSITVTIKAGAELPTVAKKLTENGSDYYPLNPYHLDQNIGTENEFIVLNEVIRVIKEGSSNKWYDKSDSMTDYFDTAFYFYVNIGQYKKPYQVNNKVTLSETVKRLKGSA
jgi:hypothetical protein